MSIEITPDNRGVTITTSRLESTGRLGMGGVEEYEDVHASEFVTFAKAAELALKLLEASIRPGAFSVVKDIVRQNLRTP